ncbi:response regulator [Halothiobacillus sp.]|uniref:ATP-binding response regulator n=1 Tax=Halothiobacillus sp. TaxID=1891311 RepID=UPI002A453BC6|nr:response regulator [Halothiobacillus sp.]
MKQSPTPQPQRNFSPFSHIWPLLLGLLLTPWLLYLPVESTDTHLKSLTVLGMIGIGLGWTGLWLGITILVQLFSKNRIFLSRDHAATNRDRPEISVQQIAQINQHWVTPLGHIRAATDTLAETNENPQINERLTPELAVIRAANAELRLAIENVLDYYEAATNRLKATPRKTDIRLQIEDAVAEWEIFAQQRVGLIQYICFQDIPGLVAIDIRLLRRLIDNLLVILIQQPDINDCSVTLLEADAAEELELETSHSNGAGSETNCTFNLVIDGKSPGPLDHFAEALSQPRIPSIRKDTDPLFMGTDLSVWLIGQFCKQLNATLSVGETREGRQGFRLTFSAPVLGAHQPWQPWLRGRSCAVITQSATHAQAWRGHLSAFGADIVLDPDHGEIDCLFIDNENWQRLSADPPLWFQHVSRHGRIIALCTQLSLRGRPVGQFDWAQISLPMFIRQRVLQTLLPRILQNDKITSALQKKQPITTHTSQNQTEQSLPSFTGRTALVIDDDRIYQSHLVNLLQQIGVTTLSAQDGKSGLYQAEHADLDLVLTDMHLPDILGTGIVRMLRKQDRHKHTPVIAITANIQTEVHQSLLHAGADIVLTKPVSLGELINAISQFLQPLNPDPPPSCTVHPRDQVLDTLLCDELPIYRQNLMQSGHNLATLRHLAHKLRGAAACCQAKSLQTHAGILEDLLLSDPADHERIALLTKILINAIDETITERGCVTTAH